MQLLKVVAPRGAPFVDKYVKEFVHLKVLTHQVFDEVQALFHDIGLPIPGARLALQDDGDQSVLEPAVVPPLREALLHPPPCASSRFAQDFERLELLGRGAFGEVWRVRSRVDLREYAVKVVPYYYTKEGGQYDHPTLRETRVWGRLDHPNIVRYHATWVEVGDSSDGADPSIDAPGPQPAAIARGGGPLPLAAPLSRSRSDRSDVLSGSTTADATDGAASASPHAGEGWEEEDESDAGVIFESSVSGDGSPNKAATEADEVEEMQFVPRRPPAPKALLKQRATLYVQTELVRGGSLREWIDRRNAAFLTHGENGDVAKTDKRRWQRAGANIFLQLVDVVNELHSQGFVHRDIKPANILLTEEGNVRLGDFGLAKVLGSLGSAAVGAPGGSGAAAPPRLQQQLAAAAAAGLGDGRRWSALTEVQEALVGAAARAGAGGGASLDDFGLHTRGVGTPSYASPEQLQRHYGTKVDVYALGVVLAELLCPVGTQMERQVLLEGLRAARRLPTEAEEAHPGAACLVKAMTSADPRERPSAADIAECCSSRTPQPHSQETGQVAAYS